MGPDLAATAAAALLHGLDSGTPGPPLPYLGRRMLGEDHSLTPGAEAAYIIVSVLLIIFSGLMAGLTLGLLSLDRIDLEVLRRSGTDKDRWLVERVAPLLANPHYLLATLLLCNVRAGRARRALLLPRCFGAPFGTPRSAAGHCRCPTFSPRLLPALPALHPAGGLHGGAAHLSGPAAESGGSHPHLGCALLCTLHLLPPMPPMPSLRLPPTQGGGTAELTPTPLALRGALA